MPREGHAGRVAREIKQSQPFRRPEREMAVTLMRTSDVLHHAVDRALRPWGVSPEQYNVLRILRGAGAGGYPTLEIADRMIARSPNITRMIDKMVGKGLAQRRRVEGDRRVVRISITSVGRRLLGDLDGAIDEVLARLAFMKRAQVASLVALLDAVRERLAVPTARQSAAVGRDRTDTKQEGT